MTHRPGPLCGDSECPCARPNVPCLGFEDYGSDDYDRRWCARCGWEAEDHPTPDDLRHTPAGQALMAEAWDTAVFTDYRLTGLTRVNGFRTNPYRPEVIRDAPEA